VARLSRAAPRRRAFGRHRCRSHGAPAVRRAGTHVAPARAAAAAAGRIDARGLARRAARARVRV